MTKDQFTALMALLRNVNHELIKLNKHLEKQERRKLRETRPERLGSR